MRVRAATPADALAVAGIHVRGWQEGYAGLLPADVLAAMRPEDRADSYTFGDPAGPYTYIAEDGHGIAGFVTMAIDRGECGVVASLYVEPTRWRTGVGSALMGHVRAELAQRGCRTGVLWVLVGNERADRFYRSHGWSPTGTFRRAVVWDVGVDEVEYRTDIAPA